MADGEVRAQDLAQETASTLSGNEQFVMFDSTAGKRADIDDVAKYIAGDKSTLKTTDKTSPVAAINENFDAIADVKEDFINGYSDLSVVNGSFYKNGTFSERTDRLRTNMIPVLIGDKIVIDNGSLKHAVGAWNGTPSDASNIRNDNTFNNADETIVSEVNGYYVVVFAKQDTSQTITPSDFDGYVHLYNSATYKNSVIIDELEDNVDSLSDTLDEAVVTVNVPIYEDLTVAINGEAGYYAKNGAYTNDPNYTHSQKIQVNEGDIITPISTVPTAYFRFVCAYDGLYAVSSAGDSSGAAIYTVPSGIDGVIVSYGNSQLITAVNIKRITGYVKKVYPISQKLGYTNWTGSLSNGTTIKLLPSNVRFNVVWAFTGHVGTMGKVSIGIKPDNEAFKELCSVDSTYIYYRLNNGSITSEAHGLTINEDLQIRIESTFLVNELYKIVICSDGTEFTPMGTAYATDMNGAPTLISDGATMTDCAFSWIPQDIDKPIWVFGDSWVSMYESRWTYYMTEAGYDNTWLLNGYAGEKTQTALVALKNLMSIRKPEYIVWLLGMNDADSGSAVNSQWKSVYDELLTICDNYKINLILYTVPNTPTINNNFKNAIVEASGYRYIDGVAAVGDDGSGNWFTGFEQSPSDHNHTSAKGARALFMRILTDFPEIAGKGI